MLEISSYLLVNTTYSFTLLVQFSYSPMSLIQTHPHHHYTALTSPQIHYILVAFDWRWETICSWRCLLTIDHLSYENSCTSDLHRWIVLRSEKGVKWKRKKGHAFCTYPSPWGLKYSYFELYVFGVYISDGRKMIKGVNMPPNTTREHIGYKIITAKEFRQLLTMSL